MGDMQGDVRVQIVITLFFICVIAGGLFLSMYTFLPKTESTDSHIIVGIILEAISWVFLLFMYLYSCLRPRVVALGNHTINGGRGPGLAQPSPITTNDGPDEIPPTPLHSSGSDDKRHVHFGSVKAVDKKESNGAEGVPLDMAVGHVCRDIGCKNLCNSTSSTSNNADMSIGSSKESEIPLRMGACEII